MQPSTTLVEQFSSVTLAASVAADEEDWKQLSLLLQQRAKLIEQLSNQNLDSDQLDTVKKADFKGRELAAILSKQVKEAKTSLGEGTRARSAAKKYTAPRHSSAYDLTG